jgi:hypothetical protein
VHDVTQQSEHERLFGGRERPDRDRVEELGIPEEAADPGEGAVPVDVVARLDGALAAQVIAKVCVPGN